MSRIIAIANQKGGVGKTTTAINLSSCLAEAGKKVLTIDLDPQGNMTSGLGVDKNELENTVYDFIIIDCPPSLNMLTINAMTTADSVLVPIQCEYYALEGLSQLIHTIDLVQQRLNPDLVIDGVVFTMYDVRTNLSNQVVENVKENLDTKIYETLIPRNIRLAEAPSHGLPINMYDSKSAGTESYRMLAKEVMER